MAASAVCSIDGCGKPVRARGWCVNHYALWQRNGKPIVVKGAIKTCSIEGCEKLKKARGWCAAHYWRNQNYGSPLALRSPPAKSDVCCVEGCVSPPNGKRNMCNAHYLKWYRRGDPNAAPQRAGHGEPSKWLRDHVHYSSDECLIWPFAVGRDGRGRVSDISPQAHRAMCILTNGKPPTALHEAAHSCGKGHEGCVHPKHLYWATPIENCADQIAHGTRIRGTDRHNARLSEEQVRQIRLLKGALSQAKIGARFGVHRETIGSIHRNETWSWLE